VPMQIETTRAGARNALAHYRATGQRIALIPTMGNLHAGHLSLVEYGRQHAERVLVSIFVNPLQFAPNEDFDRYPRTLEADCALLAELGTDLVFAPSTEELYPYGRDHTTQVQVPVLSDLLCGAARPGHFNGVSSLVARLFNLIQPDLAVFGKKDYQQWRLLERMTQELLMPIEIIGLPTHRDSDGLAMSSRNAYLTPAERQTAPQLYKSLQHMQQQVLAGERDFAALTEQCMNQLTQQGWRPDYIEIRRKVDLTPAQANDLTIDLVILAVAWLGKTRLIDNLEL